MSELLNEDVAHSQPSGQVASYEEIMRQRFRDFKASSRRKPISTRENPILAPGTSPSGRIQLDI